MNIKTKIHQLQHNLSKNKASALDIATQQWFDLMLELIEYQKSKKQESTNEQQS